MASGQKKKMCDRIKWKKSGRIREYQGVSGIQGKTGKNWEHTREILQGMEISGTIKGIGRRRKKKEEEEEEEA